MQGNKNDEHMTALKRGSVAPDFWDHEYELYQDHFYDPYTKSNFTIYNDSMDTGTIDYVYVTAMYRTKEFSGWALQLWKEGKHEDAVYNLGKAMHFFTDMCQPHHASNAIGGTQENSTKHSTFETYVEERRTNYLIDSLGNDTDSSKYQSALSTTYFSDFMAKESDARAKTANGFYKNDFDPDNESTWDAVATEAMRESQEGVARVLYRFAKELTDSNSISTEVSSDDISLDIRVKTKDGSPTDFYGTDNDVYLGVELNNGRMHEWKLDKSGYNDHEAGDNDTYTVSLERASGDQIRKAWIRKQRGWEAGSMEDNWFLEEVEVNSSDDQAHFYKRVDNWLNKNDSLDIIVKDTTTVAFELTVEVETADRALTDAPGTDSDVFFGVEYSDGFAQEWLLDHSWSNDFEKGSKASYVVSGRKTVKTKVEKVWLRKTGTDDWYPASMAVDEDGKDVFSTDINEWFNESNPKIEWSVGN